MIAFKARLKESIHERLKPVYPVALEDLDMAPTPDPRLGDLALTFPFQLAKKAQESAPGHRPGSRSPARFGRRRRQGRGRRGRIPQPLARQGRGLRRSHPPRRPDLARARKRTRSSSSTPISTRTRPPTSATSATPVSATRWPGVSATRASGSRSRTTSTTPASRSSTSSSASRSSRRSPWKTCSVSPAGSITIAGTSTPGSPPTSPTTPRPSPGRPRS